MMGGMRKKEGEREGVGRKLEVNRQRHAVKQTEYKHVLYDQQ